MFKITYQNVETGFVIVEDEEFGLRYEFVEPNFVEVKVDEEYDLVFVKKDGAIKKISILER
jgi:hypothetical protein